MAACRPRVLLPRKQPGGALTCADADELPGVASPAVPPSRGLQTAPAAGGVELWSMHAWQSHSDQERVETGQTHRAAALTVRN